MFGKVESERIPTRKVWDHAIDHQGDVQTMKGKNLPSIQKRERGGPELCGRSTEKRVYQTIKIPSNITSLLCRQKG